MDRLFGYNPVLTCLTAVVALAGLCAGAAPQQHVGKDEKLAREFLSAFNSSAEGFYSTWIKASWNYNTNLTDHNQNLSVQANLRKSAFRKEAYENTTRFDWRNFRDSDIKRQFKKVSNIGNSVLDLGDLEEYNVMLGEMKKIYGTGQICNTTKCYSLTPDLDRILTSSRDWDELTWVWKAWRDVTGPNMKQTYSKFVDMSNKAAHENGFSDAGDYWRDDYETPGFEARMAEIWEQVVPLYRELHAYVRRRMQTTYSEHAFPETGHIPAHILGNMWAQTWSNMVDVLLPYPNHPAVDVTATLKAKNYTVLDIFKLAEEFFVSLGLDHMPPTFWNESMMVRPSDRDVVCHASAWDFYNRKDYRIKQCTDITMDWLLTTHHEMGHIQYDLQYKHLPFIYRRGGNPGFHEAIGDVMSLSVSTPAHLHKVGLLEHLVHDSEADLNYLMTQALEKIAFLPFGYLMDQWRWSVFRGDTPPSEYNKKWWQLRCKLQGVSPPVERSDDDFDPGAKYHIPSNTPYIRYFVSFIIQFQFQKALCEAAGHTGSLHSCDIYNSTAAGDKLRRVLQMGSSKPWPDAMEAITGQRKMDAAPLMEYFQPLIDWLREQNAGHDVAWDDECPSGSFSGARELSGNVVLLFGFFIVSLMTWRLKL